MKVLIVSGSRADRGPLGMVREALTASNVDWVWLAISEERQGPDDRLSSVCWTRHAIADTSNAITDHEPDLVMLLGDRFETLGAAVAANIMGVPIAHLSGGDITEGSQDDCFRHAITKLSHLHFPTNRAAAERIKCMGEPAERIHMVGSPSIDRVIRVMILTKAETFAAVGLAEPARALLVCFHPNTLGDTVTELTALTEALSRLPEDMTLVFIGPNRDAGHELIRQVFKTMASRRPNSAYHDHVEDQVYVSLLRWCDAMVGNSSAGLYEAPSLGLPAINIGDRQRGRPLAASVLSCPPDYDYILTMIDTAFRHPDSWTMDYCHNPFGDGSSAERIAKILSNLTNPKELLRKPWHPLIQSGTPFIPPRNGASIQLST